MKTHCIENVSSLLNSAWNYEAFIEIKVLPVNSMSLIFQVRSLKLISPLVDLGARGVPNTANFAFDFMGFSSEKLAKYRIGAPFTPGLSPTKEIPGLTTGTTILICNLSTMPTLYENQNQNQTHIFFRFEFKLII